MQTQPTCAVVRRACYVEGNRFVKYFGSYRQRILSLAGIAAVLVAGAAPRVHASVSHQGSGSLTVAIPGDVNDFDPLTDGLDVYDNIGRLALFDSLSQLDAQMHAQPALATSWSSSDGKTWVFHLRPHVKWHDGHAFTAADVRYSFQRLLDPKVGSYIANLGANINRVVAVDPLTVRFELKQVDASFVNTMVYISIVENGSGSSNKSHPIGTGPFEFVSWSPNEQIVLKANPDYWGGAPKISQLILKPITDPNVALINLRGGSVDLITSITPSLVSQVKALSSASLIEINPSTELDYVDFVSKKPPLNNPKVREALAMCFDLSAVQKLVYNGLGQPSNNWIAPTSPFYTPVPNFRYDPAAARTLLAQAGYPHGFPLTIEQLQGYPTLNQEAVIWQAGLQKAGIQVTLRMNEINAWIDRFGKSDYQASMDVDVQGPDPNRFFLISFEYHASQGDYLNKNLINLGIAADSTLDVTKRKALYSQLQHDALNDLPVLPIYRAPLLGVAQKTVHGFVLNGKGFFTFNKASVS